MNIQEIKEYLEAKGFEYCRKGIFRKEYGDDEAKVGIEYQIKLPRVTMFMVNSIGRKKKTMVAKLKDINISEDGTLTGFKNIINKKEK